MSVCRRSWCSCSRSRSAALASQAHCGGQHSSRLSTSSLVEWFQTRKSALVGLVGVAAAFMAVGLFRLLSWPLPPCPTRAILGVECPGCGSGRCISALLEGDVRSALSYNLLLPPALLLLVVRAAAPRSLPGRLLDFRYAAVTVAAVVGLFWLARLLPFAVFDSLRSS